MSAPTRKQANDFAVKVDKVVVETGISSNAQISAALGLEEKVLSKWLAEWSNDWEINCETDALLGILKMGFGLGIMYERAKAKGELCPVAGFTQ